MRRGPLLGITVFLASTVGGYMFGVKRREARLLRVKENIERAAAEEAPTRPVIEPVAISTEALSGELPSDFRRGGSVPKVLE